MVFDPDDAGDETPHPDEALPAPVLMGPA